MDKKNLFRKIVKREEYYLQETQHSENNGFLQKGYYEKITYHNDTHSWYHKADNGKIEFIFPQGLVLIIDKLYDDYIINQNYESTF